jgi:beta-phosphoglucomutase-like phosphatase (HAD superfamily)
MVGLTDVDGVLGDTQILAITEGTLPVMRDHQRNALGLNVTANQMFCWETGRVCTNQEFLDSIGSRSMIDMLRVQNSVHGNQLSDETLIEWDMREAAAVIQAFRKPGALKRIPGAYEFLAGMRELGVSMYAVSSSSVDRLCVTLRGLGLSELLAGIFSAQGNNGYYTDDGDGLLARVHSVASEHHYKRPLPKPDPAVYHLACHLNRINPANTFTVEDSAAGALAAKVAGIGYVIGLDTSNTEEGTQKLLNVGVDVVVTRLDDVLPLLRDHFRLAPANIESVVAA